MLYVLKIAINYSKHKTSVLVCLKMTKVIRLVINLAENEAEGVNK